MSYRGKRFCKGIVVPPLRRGTAEQVIAGVQLAPPLFSLEVLVEGREREVFSWLQPVFWAVFSSGPVNDVEGVDWARKGGAVFLTLVHHTAVDDHARAFVHWHWYKSLIAVVVCSNINHLE